jgi:hypothetical protein
MFWGIEIERRDWERQALNHLNFFPEMGRRAKTDKAGCH